MNRWTWILLLFGCVAIVLLVRTGTSESGTAESSASGRSAEPDLSMEDAVISQYQDDGSLKYELLSKRIRHFEETNLTRLDDPDLRMQQAEKPPWTARADEGEIRYELVSDESPEEIVHLRHNVFLEQLRGERFMTLSTEELYVYPDRRYAETDQTVTIDSNAGRTKAVGLAADLERSVLELASSDTQRVHTIVLPFQFKP